MMMERNKIRLHVWGDWACFTRPELKVERMSYEVMTPSAARGLLSAIYWKPQFNWRIDKIHVLKPICFTQIRRNELSDRIKVAAQSVREGRESAMLGLFIDDSRQQRAATILRDVSYVIEAHVDVISSDEDGVNSLEKHLSIFKRRAMKGQCFTQPYFGTREFPAMFSLIGDGEDLPPTQLSAEEQNRHLGLMLYDMIYRDCPKKSKDALTIIDHKKSTEKKIAYKTVSATPQFFMAELQDGILPVSQVKPIQ